MVKSRLDSKILGKISSKSSKNSLKSINEDSSNEYYASNADDVKESEHETASVSSFDSLEDFNKTPVALNRLTCHQVKLS